MNSDRLSAEQARLKGLCEKCQVNQLATMHYCESCMAVIRKRKKDNLAKRSTLGK